MLERAARLGAAGRELRRRFLGLPKRRRLAVGGIALLSIALLCGAHFLWGPARPLPELETAIWYWQEPFRIPAGDAEHLRDMGVRQLFVRAGTFRRDRDSVRLIMPQSWESPAPGLGVHLVFNFAYDIVRHFGEVSVSSAARSVAVSIGEERARAERLGVRVVGIQLDFDCPTKRLGEYAALLRAVRPLVAVRGAALSITALPTWFGDGSVDQLLSAVDFVAPQYYEGTIPRRMDRFATISRLKTLERGINRMTRIGRPYYAGLPAYGHALMYDARGDFVGLYQDLPLPDLLRHPAFRVVRAFGADADGRRATARSYIGEDIYDLAAKIPARDGRGKGYHIIYDLPTPALLEQHLAAVRAHRAANCRGVILFRYPGPNDTMALPLRAIAGAIRGVHGRPDLRVALRSSVAPWELIDTGRHAARAPVNLAVTVSNVGEAGTYFAPDAVTLTLCFDEAGVEEVVRRESDEAEAYSSGGALAPGAQPGALQACSLSRANVVRFRRSHLEAGETEPVGRISLPADGPTRVWGFWEATGAGGLERTHGVIASMSLKNTEVVR